MVANIIVDIVLVLILVIGFIWGLKAGFIKTVSKPAKFILALVLSFMFAGMIGDGIIKPLISEPVVGKLTEFITAKLSELGEGADLPTLIKLAATLAGVEIGELSDAAGNEETIATIVEAITAPVLSVITTVIAFIVLYIVLKILLGIAFAIVNAIIDNGVVGVVNRILGCIVMTLLASAVVWGLCAISDLILSLPVLAEQEWVSEFTGGWIYGFFKNLSPVDLILSVLLSF